MIKKTILILAAGLMLLSGSVIANAQGRTYLYSKYLRNYTWAKFNGDVTLGNGITDTITLSGKITSNQTYTSGTTPFYFRTSLSATSGTHNNARFRAQSTAASASTSDLRGVYAQAIANDALDAGWITAIYANPIAKGTSTTVGMRGILIDTESEGTPTSIGNMYGIYIRNKSTVAVTTDNYSITIDNEKMGSGIVQDAAIQIKTTTWGAGVTAWTYGIDMNQTGAFGTADFRLMNGETIDNTTDGIINFGAELSSLDTYSKDVGATTRDLLVDNAGLIGYQASARKFKKNIVDLNRSYIDRLYNLRPVSFDWKKSGLPGYGMIAEEAAEVMPEIVSFGKDGSPETVSYHQLTPFLLKALQDQQTRIVQLERLTERLYNREMVDQHLRTLELEKE